MVEIRIKRKNIVISMVVLVLILIFVYYSNYAKEEETEKKLLYFILSIEKTDNIPYCFESNNTVFVIEKGKIICYGEIEAVGNDINVSLPKDYEWRKK